MRSLHERLAYTLIEMLTTVALLVIVLGLMVSLARYVRNRSADVLTRDLLVKLDRMMTQYINRHSGQVPVVESLAPTSGTVEEALLQISAVEGNRQVIRILRSQQDLSYKVLADLPVSIFDGVTLRDAWGSPVGYMGSMHPAIGTAPLNRFFFVSAGPDRRFLTVEDNLYSYDQ